MSRDARADCDVSAALVACRNGVVAVAIFSFFQNLLMLSAPLYMLQVYDRVLASRSVDTLLYLTLVLALALAVLGLLDLARGRMLANVAMWLDHRLSPGLFERAVQSRLRGRGYGPEALADLATMRNFVSSSGLTAIFDLPWTAIFVAVTFMLHPYFGYITVAAVALLLFLGLIGEYATRGAIRAAAEAGMVSRRDLDATARNAEAIEAMGMMPHAVRKWAGRNSEALGLQSVILRRTTLLGSVSKFVRLIVQSLGLGVGAWLVIDQQTTGGVMIAASILMTRAVAPIEQGIGAWKNVVSARAALRRLRAFSLMPAYRPEAMPLPEPKGDLTAESVGFNIGPLSPPILRGISFSLSAGESMAVIGPSGAGKSTLARLLAGAVPPSRGVVRLDGADIFAWDREQAGRFVGYLPQDVELFSGTVLENISRLRDVDPEEIVSAAMMANVHDLILRLPKGYDTEVGEDGEHLSGGQRQRIALARAVMGNPKLVVLDEPNSNLDGDGEIALVKAMATLKQAGCTLVVVTHRMSLMQYVDKMLFLRNGQVEAFGPRQEVYARLVDQKPAAASRPGQVVVPIQQGV